MLRHSDPWLTIHGGDCREVLTKLPAESVQCVVTSPPYWGLRDYGVTGQLGLEPTPEQYVANMVDVFGEVRRVLRDDGTVWLNLGDSYISGQGGRQSAVGACRATIRQDRPIPKPRPELAKAPSGWAERAVTPRTYPAAGNSYGWKPKDLAGIPWRVAFALQADGWYLRSDIIWAKPNPMPESVTDRPTKAHEYLFLLSKRSTYFYDVDAVRENGVATDAHGQTGGGYGVTPPGQRPQQGNRGPVVVSTPIGTRNLRSVWTIATAPYPGAHFATFPPKLVEPCILAGTSERGACPDCGASWERVVERETRPNAPSLMGKYDGKGRKHRTVSGGVSNDARISIDVGWRPTCAHGAEPVPSVVLDPFAGTGTVGMVAQRLSRRAVLIDLNPEYLTQCLERNRDMPLGLTVGLVSEGM